MKLLRFLPPVALLLAAALLPARAQAAPAPRPAGLVAWWPADGFALDVAGTNYGTLRNGTTYADGLAGPASVIGARPWNTNYSAARRS